MGESKDARRRREKRLFAHIVAHKGGENMPQQVSMADIAARAGVSQATVSRALRGNPRISEEQRRRIVQLAQAMGYRPNPLVSALMAVRRSPRRPGGVETIAFVSSYRAPKEWRDKPTCVQAFAGMEERAAELGFKMEVFSTREYRTPGRLEKVLHTRGVRGCILGFTDTADEKLPLCQDGLAVAGLGAYFPRVSVDRTQVHGFYNVKLGLRCLRELGYERIGLAVPRYNNMLVGHTWSAAYLDEQWSLPKARRSEPFLPDTAAPAASEFGRWLDRHQLDAVLVYKMDALSLAKQLRRRVPKDLGVAFLYRTDDEVRTAAGVDENIAQIGRATVDLVVEKLHTNRLGATSFAREVLTCGFWCDGPTVRKAGRANPRRQHQTII
jgi:LacI family transcriptional regulator